MVQWLVLSPQRKKVPDSNPGWTLSVWSLHVIHGAWGFSFSCSVLLLQSKDMYVRSVLRKCTDVAFAVHSTAKSLQLYMKKCYSETINLLMQSFQVVSNGLFIPSYVTELLPINLIRCEVFHREPGQRLRSTG